MIDKEKIKILTKDFLIAIGEDPCREGLLDTPRRVADMCEELLVLNEKDMNYTAFTNITNNSFVLVKDIDFFSFCEHHLAPFFGKVHIGYIANEKIIGLSKLARIVEKNSKKLQLQERLMKEIELDLENAIAPKGIAVCIEATHMCMCMRGVKKVGSNTVTTLFRGDCDTPEIRQQFTTFICK